MIHDRRSHHGQSSGPRRPRRGPARCRCGLSRRGVRGVRDGDAHSQHGLPTLTVTEIDADRVDGDSAVAYGTLTTEQRATFDRARNGSTVEGFDDAWRDIDRVEYEGRYYNVGIVVC